MTNISLVFICISIFFFLKGGNGYRYGNFCILLSFVLALLKHEASLVYAMIIVILEVLFMVFAGYTNQRGENKGAYIDVPFKLQSNASKIVLILSLLIPLGFSVYVINKGTTSANLSIEFSKERILYLLLAILFIGTTKEKWKR